MQRRMNLYWLWMPVIHCVILVLGHFFIFFLLMDPNNHDWGGIVQNALVIVFYALVVTPLLAVLYCKKINGMGWGWTKYLCCLYNSLMMGMYFVVITIPFNNLPINLNYLMTVLISVPGLSIIIPSLICGIVTLVIYDVKSVRSIRYNRKQNIV